MLLASDIINDASKDLRSVIDPTGDGGAFLLGYVDRIHKDVLHTSIYSHLARGMVTVNVSAGTSSYPLGAGDLRRVLTVFDRTSSRVLLPLSISMSPLPTGDQSGSDPTQVSPLSIPQVSDIRNRFSQSGYAEYFLLTDSNTLTLFPTPNESGSVEVYYEQQVPTINTIDANLTVPDDARDMLVAGVNYLASQYLKKSEEAASWFQLYQRLKRGEVVI